MFIKLFSFCKHKIEFFRPNQMSKSSWCHIWMSRYFKICTVFQFSSPLYGRFFFYKSTWRWQMWKTKKWVVLYSTINNVLLATEYIRYKLYSKGQKMAFTIEHFWSNWSWYIRVWHTANAKDFEVIKKVRGVWVIHLKN